MLETSPAGGSAGGPAERRNGRGNAGSDDGGYARRGDDLCTYAGRCYRPNGSRREVEHDWQSRCHHCRWEVRGSVVELDEEGENPTGRAGTLTKAPSRQMSRARRLPGRRTATPFSLRTRKRRMDSGRRSSQRRMSTTPSPRRRGRPRRPRKRRQNAPPASRP